MAIIIISLNLLAYQLVLELIQHQATYTHLQEILITFQMIFLLNLFIIFLLFDYLCDGTCGYPWKNILK